MQILLFTKLSLKTVRGMKRTNRVRCTYVSSLVVTQYVFFLIAYVQKGERDQICHFVPLYITN